MVGIFHLIKNKTTKNILIIKVEELQLIIDSTIIGQQIMYMRT